MTFEEWMAEVDRVMAEMLDGLSHLDIADYTWRDDYDGGTTPCAAALAAIDADGSF